MMENWKNLVETACEWKNELTRTLDRDAGNIAVYFNNLIAREYSGSDYKHIGEAKKIIYDFQHRKGVEATQILLKLIIAEAIESTSKRRLQTQLPEVLNSNQLFHFARILSQKNFNDNWLNISTDLFLKEFGLASERLYAAGSQLLDRHCGVPRSIIYREGIATAPAKLIFFAKLAGFRPMIQIHTHAFNLDRFNEAGWDECYRGCAELYRVFPELLGVFGSSWFYDPAIPRISPRLNYLQATPQVAGAAFFYYSSDDSAIANATSTSDSRKKLYKEGGYHPKNYMMIWSKKSQSAWAEKNQYTSTND